MTTTMGIPATDYQDCDPNAGCTEKEFKSRADLKEGISGLDKISARFENTERKQVLAPRSDVTGHPAPRDARFPGADNHGEWGPDQSYATVDIFDIDTIDTDEG